MADIHVGHLYKTPPYQARQPIIIKKDGSKSMLKLASCSGVAKPRPGRA